MQDYLLVFVILQHVQQDTGRMTKDKLIQQIQISLFVLLAQPLKHVVLNVTQVMVRLVLNVLVMDSFILQDNLKLLV